MTIIWRPNGGDRFSFGNLAPHQVQMFEDSPDLAMQKLLQWYGKDNPNFGMTTLGRYIASQMDSIQNDEMMAQAQQVADENTRRTAWQRGEDQRKAAWDAEYNRLNQAWQDAETNYGSGNHPDVLRAKDAFDAFKAAGFTKGVFDEKPGITLTSFMENNPKYSNLVEQFNMLPSNLRGANPGTARVRRQIW